MIVFKPTSLKEKNEKKQADARLKAAVEALENALCDLDENNAERFAAIEDALCELDVNDAGNMGGTV